MKCIIIRKIGKNDIDKFIEIYESGYGKMDRYFYKNRKAIKKYFKWLIKRDGFFIMEGNEAISFIVCDSNWIGLYGKVGEIHEIAVKKEWKKRGIGKMLVRIAENYLKAKGCNVFELWVGEKNDAIKFYKKLGYKEKEKIGEWIRMEKASS